MTRFVILAAPRTGSNLLCTLLNSHPHVLCHHEIFNPRGIFYALNYRDGSISLGSLDERDRNPLEFLERVWRWPGGFPCVGFKMTRDQCDVVMERVIENRTIRKIVLRRHNRLKTFVSEMIAHETDQWEAYASCAPVVRIPKIRIAVKQLLAHVQMNDTFYRRIARALETSDQACLEVSYEKVLLFAEQTRMLRFLGVSPEDNRLKPLSIKQNPLDLRCVIENFSELDACLEGSEFHRELHELQN